MSRRLRAEVGRHGVADGRFRRSLVRPLSCVLLALVTTHASRGHAEDHGPRTAMGLLSAAYALNACGGAHIAIRDDLHEAPFGMRSSRNVRAEFLFGTGTAMSPGLPFLVTQAVSTVLAFQPGETGKVGSTLLAVHGAGFFIGGLAEPGTYRVLAHPRRAGFWKFALVVGEIAIPPLLAIESTRVHRAFSD